MATHVLTLSTQQIQALEDYLSNSLVSPPPHTIFQAKWFGIVITAYKSGKVVLQGNDVDTAIKDLERLSLLPTANQQLEKNLQHSGLPDDFFNWSVIGSDEVGNGSYFGPLTVAASYVASHQIPLLQELGVKDSKNLTDQQIQELAPQLKVTIPYKLLVLWPEKYNDVQQHMNLNVIKAKMHNQALYLLQQNIQPLVADAYLIDQFCEPKTYYRYLKNETNSVTEHVYFATKAEQYHLAVASASIIARDAFLNGLEELGRKYLVTLPSGAGKNVDQIAATILKNQGMNTLRCVAKIHFANTLKAQKLVSSK